MHSLYLTNEVVKQKCNICPEGYVILPVFACSKCRLTGTAKYFLSLERPCLSGLPQTASGCPGKD